MSTGEAALAHVRAVADAVLYEGHLLYPRRTPETRNQARHEFGVLVPPGYATPGSGEHAECRTECLAEAGAGAELRLRVRFLQLQRRTVERRVPGGYQEAESLTVSGQRLLPCDEAVEREHDIVLPLRQLFGHEQAVPITVRGAEQVTGVDGGRVVRRRKQLVAELRCRADILPGLVRLRTVLVNTAEIDCAGHTHAEVLRHSLVAAHTVLSLRGGRFLSLREPPRWAAEYATGCVNQHTWPVLVGEPGARDSMLSSPIILSDYPDADPARHREVDACALDLPRTRLPGAEPGPRAGLDQLVPAVPDPMDELPEQKRQALPGTVSVGGIDVGPGSRVRLRPARNGDARDSVVAGQVGTVQAVLVDVDEVSYLAVTMDGEQAGNRPPARDGYRYVTLNEVEPCPDGGAR
jgi:hypothetical protein